MDIGVVQAQPGKDLLKDAAVQFGSTHPKRRQRDSKPSFGQGNNAFRRSDLESLGSGDSALGAAFLERPAFGAGGAWTENALVPSKIVERDRRSSRLDISGGRDQHPRR